MRLLPLLVGPCCNVWVALAAGSRSQFQGGHTPWATVRALLGSSHPAPAAAPAGAPGATQPMPNWAAQTTMAFRSGVNAAPAAAAPPPAAPAAIAGPAADPCYACVKPSPQPEVNKDLQEVAADQAQQEVEDAAADAQKDSQAAIASEGKKNLRDVQASNTAAVDQAADGLKASAEAQEAGMEQDSARQLTAAEHESHVAAEFSKFLTAEGIKQEGAQTSAKYIESAQTILRDLVKQIHKAGKEMSHELKTTASVGTTATNETEKMVIKAEEQKEYAIHFMDEPLAAVHKAQVGANNTEDAVRSEALATRFGSQAVQHGTEEAKKAQQQATAANLTSKFIFSKVMKTKAGIAEATEEVEHALVKASNAHIESQSAVFQAEKLLKKSVR